MKLLNYRQLYKSLGYSPTTYSSNKMPKSKKEAIINLIQFIEKWVEENKNK